MSKSDSIVSITVNGFSDTRKASDDIIRRVLEAAKIAVEVAAEFHLNMAVSNVKNAYTTAGYPPISGMYARWLAVRDPRFASKYPELASKILSASDWDYADAKMNKILEEISETIYDNKQSMVSNTKSHSDSLLGGLGIVETEETMVSFFTKVASQAKYSRDLEYGYLFGKYRGAGKKRPFFTGHITDTKFVMRTRFKKELKEIR